MPRILVTSSRQAGLVLPLLQLVAALTGRGDTVFFLGGDEFRGRIEAAGATFVRLPYDDQAPPAVTRPNGRRNGPAEIVHLLERIFLEPLATDHAVVRRLVAELSIDVVMTEPLFLGSTILGLLPRAERPAVLSIGLFPLPFGGPDVAPYGFAMTPSDSPLNTLRNSALALVNEALTGGVRRRFVAEAERLTGVRVPRGGIFDLALTVDAYAETTVPAFEYPRRRWPDPVRFVGPIPPPTLGGLPDWFDFTDRRPLVYVTQGTYANVDFGELIVPALRALADEDVRVVVTTGGPDPDVVRAAYGGPLPSNARVATLLPYQLLLPATRVVVTNGGYGTVHHALGSGVPLVVSGTSEDKPEVNARVAWSGAGVDLRRQRPEPAEIRAGVLAVLGDKRYRGAARRLAAQIADTDAVTSVLAIVDELVGGQLPAQRTPKVSSATTGRGASR